MLTTFKRMRLVPDDHSVLGAMSGCFNGTIVALLISVGMSAPSYVTMGFLGMALITGAVKLAVFVYLAKNDPDQLRSERFSLLKLRMTIRMIERLDQQVPSEGQGEIAKSLSTIQYQGAIIAHKLDRVGASESVSVVIARVRSRARVLRREAGRLNNEIDNCQSGERRQRLAHRRTEVLRSAGELERFADTLELAQVSLEDELPKIKSQYAI